MRPKHALQQYFVRHSADFLYGLWATIFEQIYFKIPEPANDVTIVMPFLS